MKSKLSDVRSVCDVIPSEAFASIAKRVIRRLGESKLLLPKEEEQAKSALGLTSEQISSVVELCAFLFEQAAYQTQQGDEFEASAQSLGKHASVARQVWEAEAGAYVAKLKAKHLIGSSVLKDTTWTTNLRLDTVEPTAVFNLDLGDDHLAIETSHAELSDFFNKLQAIQKTIDGLSAS